MHPCIEQSNDLAPLSPSRSWLDCITNTSGYDFRKGQGVCGQEKNNPIAEAHFPYRNVDQNQCGRTIRNSNNNGLILSREMFSEQGR
jgi:hypothetical protein